MESISETLLRLGLASKKTSKVFSNKTRDRSNLKVMRDSNSGVIYIDDFYVGNEEYEDGQYRKENMSDDKSRDFEAMADLKRRLAAHNKHYVGLDICDFGCGFGDFLYGTKNMAKSVCAVELQKDFAEKLISDGIPCKSSIEEHKKQFDTVFLFHSFEHFEHPIDILLSIKKSLKKGGRVVIEVPHANDFLISTFKHKPFIDFTLWSQHLILHTRNSLNMFLADAGFSNINIEGVQRYPLSNHLTWLSSAKPGGHKSSLAAMDSPELNSAYTDALNKLDATDTIVAVATS